MSQEFDIIFAGGGTVACVAAGRLASARPDLKILLIEAGPHTYGLLQHVQPGRYTESLVPASKVLSFHASKPSDALLGRSTIVPTGKCVGGGSSVNFMVYARAAASDYDDWEAHGNQGWGAKDMIPLLKKAETYQEEGTVDRHGYSGPIKVSSGGILFDHGKQFLEVARAYDPSREISSDLNNCSTADSYGWYMKFIDKQSGRRSDAAHHFIYNQLSGNTNLQVLADRVVHRVLIRDKQAVGVEYSDASDPSSAVIVALAKHLVIVSAGTLGSPAILERSGVGAAELLTRFGIKQEVDLPGVGENYMDHNALFVPYFTSESTLSLDVLNQCSLDEMKMHVEQWERNGNGLLATNGIDAGARLRPHLEDLEELGPHFKKVWAERFAAATDKPVVCMVPLSGYSGQDPDPQNRYMTMSFFTTYPVSTGRVHIASADDWQTGLDFEPGFLTEPADLDALRWAYKRSREIARRMSLYRGELAQEHPMFPPDSNASCGRTNGPVEISAPDIPYTVEDDEAINKYIRLNVQTTWHSMGTCSMKPRDRGGVVDSALNVYGIRNLKVADLSICPGNVGANTYSTALGIGEKAALIIAKEMGFGL